MGTNIDKYKQILEKLDQLASNDENFKMILCKKYGGLICHDVSLSENVAEIRRILRIEASQSIDYSFIPDKYQRVRDQLIIDNLRMENSRLDIKITNDFERFYNFCTNAFYQIENLINYYYYRRFPNINDFLDYLEKIPNTKFKRTIDPETKDTKEKNVNDVVMATKIYSFTTEHNLHKNITSNISSLRTMRNEGLHRCSVIQKDENPKDKNLLNYFKYQTVGTVRNTVNNIVEIVRPKEIKREANISSILPSACYAKFVNGVVESIPISLTKGLNIKTGDNIIATIICDCEEKTIINIEKV